MQSSNKLTNVLSIIVIVSTMGTAPSLVVAQNAATPAPSRRSSLPDAALKLAQQAEQQLAANAPEKAIAILRDLDKQYPNTAALSLRLAQINDTLNRNGYALFYYRRYVNMAGPDARDLAVERVTTLELMSGVGDAANKAAQDLGETTKAIATPRPKIQGELETEAKDGTRIVINNENDLERLRKQGVPPTAPSTPVPTPPAAFVIPPELTARKTPVPVETQPVKKPVAAAAPKVSAAARTTPAPSDEDALMANAFTKTGSESSEAPEMSASSILADLSENGTSSSAPPPPPPAPRTALPPTMAFTKKTPVHESGRAASFFNVTEASGPQAQVSLVNDLPAAVVTFSLTPEDNGEVISAILVPGEKRTLLIKPARYDVTANASSNDYSPITLMNTQFKFAFEAGRQYSRRFNKNTLEQVN